MTAIGTKASFCIRASTIALGALLATPALGAVINVPGDQPTIQAGINAAVSGVDEVVVAPGTYNEIIDFSGKAITVVSSGGAGVTTIDATGVTDPGTGLPVVRFDSAEGADSVLEGFTLSGGTGDTTFSPGSFAGGGIFISGASPTVRACTIENNTGDVGAGAFAYQGGLTIGSCVFQNNTVVNNGGCPGLYLYESSATVSGCSFLGLSSPGDRGGALHIESGTGSVSVSDSVFESNSSALSGGAVWSGFSGSSLTIERCAFRDNSTPGAGGGAIFTVGNADVRIADCEFVGNSASGAGDGGAISITNASTLVANCVFSHNASANKGGAVVVTRDASVVNCSFAGNTAGGTGSGIAVLGQHTRVFTNCIFWGNTGGDAVALVVTDPVGTPPVLNSSIYQGGWTGSGSDNLDVNPLFVDAANDDLSLQAGSPAIDSADFDTYLTLYGIGLDAAGNPRTVDDPNMPDIGIGAVAYLDRGAYEFQPAVCVGDVTTQGAAIGTPGYGVPDGMTTADDINYFVNHWLAGCP